MYTIFDSGKLYGQREAELLEVFGSQQLLTQWRCRGKGPAYLKVGRSVYYRGEDLNAYLWRNRVVTEDAKAAEAKRLANAVRAKKARFEEISKTGD